MNATNYRQLLAVNLLQLMEKHEYTQQGLHRQSGVSQAKIGYLLRQEQDAGTNVLERLANVFSLEPWQLIAPTIMQDRGLVDVTRYYAKCGVKKREAIVKFARGRV